MIKKIISTLILVLFIWQIWSFNGRNQPLEESETIIDTVQEINPSDSLHRTLLGIQPYMVAQDYFSPVTLENKLRKYLKEAQDKGLLKNETVVLFPEFIGNWLVLDGEKHAIAQKKTLKEATQTMVWSNLFEIGVFAFRASKDQDLMTSAIFRMKSRKMAKDYVTVFGNLARDFGVSIVAGSIVLAGPELNNGNLTVDESDPLFNISLVFDPKGNIVGGPIKKSFPNAKEQEFVNSFDANSAQVLHLPVGSAAVLIGSDTWYPAAYTNALSSGSNLILSPSYAEGEHAMGQLWAGYSGFDTPTGVDENEIGKLTVLEAWMKYGLPGKVAGTKASVGMNVFFRGEFWDLKTDGQPLVFFHQPLKDIQPAERGGIWALNF